MTTLAMIAAQYRADADKLADLDLDEQTVADTLEAMAGDLEIKAQSVAHMVRAFEADAAAVAQWAKDASARAKAIEARAERLRDYLAHCLDQAGIEKIDGPGIRISWRKSSAVVIDDETQIPLSLMVCPPAPEPRPDKVSIASEIKAGRDVPGAHVEQRRSLQIK